MNDFISAGKIKALYLFLLLLLFQVKIETPNAIDGYFAPPLIEAVSESTLNKYKAILPNSEEDQKVNEIMTALYKKKMFVK